MGTSINNNKILHNYFKYCFHSPKFSAPSLLVFDTFPYLIKLISEPYLQTKFRAKNCFEKTNINRKLNFICSYHPSLFCTGENEDT